MPTIALEVLTYLDDHNDASSAEKRSLLNQVPTWQWKAPGGHWTELRQHCQDRIDPALERRPVNGLNIEIGSPAARCLLRTPDGRGLLWWLSGGSILAYGCCEFSECPRGQQAGSPTG